KQGRVVPEPGSLALSNQAIELSAATVLYADLDGSTAMVEAKKWQFSAEIYKAFLYCAARIIRSEGGAITSYAGDRIMGIFLGDAGPNSAARTGLKINWAVKNIVNPLITSGWADSTHKVRHTVGIDRSDLRAARTGVRGDNDIVWVGSAANHAAKLN